MNASPQRTKPDLTSTSQTLTDVSLQAGRHPGARWFKMTVGYDGTAYSGWQVQPGRITIQAMLEKAITEICRESVRVTGSGRTDSGVHAIGQVASFALQRWNATADDLCRALNSKLPSDIAVRSIVDAPEDFHAIRDARGKRYRYQLQVGGPRDAFEFRYRWHLPGPIDLDRMREAGSLLIGSYDFASFQAAGSDRKTTVRDVRDLVIVEQVNPRTPPSDNHGDRQGTCSEGRYVGIEVEADGFLYNMVRNIVGTLLEVGRGKQPPSWVTEVVLARDRNLAGPTAPPHGLCLMRVDYDF